MAQSTTPYDPSKVSVTYDGQVIDGFADGTFINAARLAPSGAVAVGADGRYLLIKSADKSMEITLTLMQNSDGNATLKAYEALGTDGIKPLQIKDLVSGVVKFSAEKALISQVAAIELGKEASPREWKFVCGEAAINP